MIENKGFQEFVRIKMEQEKQIRFDPGVYKEQLTNYGKNLQLQNETIMEITTEYETIKNYFQEWEKQKVKGPEADKIVSILTDTKSLISINLQILGQIQMKITLQEAKRKKDIDNRKYASFLIEPLLDKNKYLTIGRIVCSLERASTLYQNEVEIYNIYFPQLSNKESITPKPVIQNVGTVCNSFLLHFVGDKAFITAFILEKDKKGMNMNLAWPESFVSEMTTACYYFFTKSTYGFRGNKSIVYKGTEPFGPIGTDNVFIKDFVEGFFKENIARTLPIEYHISEYNDTFLFDRIINLS